jgi:hypothetical protein
VEVVGCLRLHELGICGTTTLEEECLTIGGRVLSPRGM